MYSNESQLPIISKTTTIHTKHDCKLRKVVHKWKIMTIFIYHKTEYLYINIYYDHQIWFQQNKAIWDYLIPEMMIGVHDL